MVCQPCATAKLTDRADNICFCDINIISQHCEFGTLLANHMCDINIFNSKN